MPHEKESAPSLVSERASVNDDNQIIPHRPYDMARDDPETWERAWRGVGVMLCIAWAIGMILYSI